MLFVALVVFLPQSYSTQFESLIVSTFRPFVQILYKNIMHTKSECDDWPEKDLNGKKQTHFTTNAEMPCVCVYCIGVNWANLNLIN